MSPKTKIVETENDANNIVEKPIFCRAINFFIGPCLRKIYETAQHDTIR